METVNQSEWEKGAPFVREFHKKYLESLDGTKDSDAIGHYTNEHLKLPGAYWCIGAIKLLDDSYLERKDEIVKFILACQHENGGFGGNIGHDPHITSTLYAILVLAMYDSLDQLDKEKVVNHVLSLQNEDGSFNGDEWGEVDTRFSYCGLSTLSLLNALDRCDKIAARDYLLKCQNIDGAFGGIPDAESHAAYTFCCVGALNILGDIDLIDKDKLGSWMSRRQTL